MRRLKTLTLKNISRVELAEIHFGMLTRIAGENGAGKTMCTFDALQIVCLGAPFTEDMVRGGAKFASIKLEFTDGSWIERVRDRSKQSCTICQADGEQITYDTVNDIKDKIQEFTGFKMVELVKDDKESFQFIGIDDPQTYLLDGTSDATALRKLTKVMGGTGAETAKATLESEVRTLVSQRDVQTKLAADVEKRMSEIWSQIDVLDMEQTISDMEELRQTAESAERKLQTINALLDREDALLDQNEKLAAVYSDAEIASKIEELRSLIDTLNGLEGKKIRIDALLVKRRRFAVDLPPLPDLSGIEESRQNWLELQKKMTRVRDLLAKDDELYFANEGARQEIEQLDKQIMEMKKTKPTCPTCNQLLPEVAA